MRLLLALAAIIFGIVVIALQLGKKHKKLNFFESKESQSLAPMVIDKSIIDLKALTSTPLYYRLRNYMISSLIPLGHRGVFKVCVYYAIVFGGGIYLNWIFLQLSLLLVFPILLLVSTLLGVGLLRKLAVKHFNASFPDALNLLASAISAGESLMHAIIYVGEQMPDNDVGREFKLMGERLQIGEAPNVVLKRACQRFPYAEFIFFSITLRANIERGGQLRDIINQLNRVMFDSRSLEKKKNAMTAEARMSAKIVFAIPFVFMIIMRFLAPENFNYVFSDSHGHLILYYVLISEAIGMFIISMLMRGVK